MSEADPISSRPAASPVERRLEGESATAALARALAPLAGRGDVIALWGDLGTGKTAFARAFIRALGESDVDVPSPTFTLVQVYEGVGHAPVWHFDLYRLSSPDDVWELGFEEALADGISLIEWPDRLDALLPEPRLNIALTHGTDPSERFAKLLGTGPWPDRLGEAGLV